VDSSITNEIHVSKTQWPVGQGCFASGTVRADKDNVFEYIYDCGSENMKALRSCLSVYRPYNNTINALFLSHLDSDHVSGLDSLFVGRGFAVERVYIPYLDVPQKIMLMVEAVSSGNFSGTYLDLLYNTEEWFAHRGVKEIIYIKSENEDKDDIPSQRFNRLGFKRDEDSDKYRPETIHCTFTKSPTVQMVRSVDGFKVKVYSGPNEMNINFGGQCIWVLVPHVPTVEQNKLGSFMEEVGKVLDLKQSDIVEMEHVKNYVMNNSSDLRKLKEAYRKIHSHHNFVSMLLYSGPYIESRSVCIRWYGHQSKLPGWLGTGDGPLKTKKVFSEMKDRYQQYIPFIGSVMCPHHGSKWNFTSRIIREFKPETMFVSSGSQGKHPHDEVVTQIRHLGCNYHHISEKPDSLLKEEHKILLEN